MGNNLRISVNGQEVDLDGAQIRRRRRGGCRTGCSIIFTLLIVAIAGGVVYLTTTDSLSMMEFLGPYLGVEVPGTTTISGDPSAFDPLAGYADAAAFAAGEDNPENVLLLEMDAAYVRADGTMDLNATYSPAPNTTYTFLRSIPRPEDAPPPGVAGTSASGDWFEVIDIRAFEPGQRRRVTQRGSVNVDYYYTNEGMTRIIQDRTNDVDMEDIVPAPTCALTDLWEVALARGAPENAVAVISYDADGYQFNIVGEMVLRFNANCQLR
jgi:hypothetical protein